MSARTQHRQQARLARKVQTPPRRSYLWRYVATIAFLLLATFGALAASSHAPRTDALAQSYTQPAQPQDAPTTTAPQAARVQPASYALHQTAETPASPAVAPVSSGDRWILAPDTLPVPAFPGDIPPLPVAHSAQDAGFHPDILQKTETDGDAIILTCLNPETNNAELIVGKRGRDTVFALKDPQSASLPTAPVQDVQAGNLVVSRDPDTGQTNYRRVTATVQRPADALVTLSLADAQTGKAADAITCTPEHPFQVVGGGWVEAGSLAIGSSIVTRAGPPLVVKEISWQRSQDGSKPYTVYNMTVQGDHSYFVGTASGGMWVHNSCTNVAPGENPGEHMAGSPYSPTQKQVFADKVNNLAADMEQNGFRQPNAQNPLIVDENGTILSGHHRIVAAHLSGTPIPESYITRVPTTVRVPRPWGSVTVR